MANKKSQDRIHRYFIGVFVLGFTFIACIRNEKKGHQSKTISAESIKSVPLAHRFSTEQTFAFILPQLKPVDGVGGVAASDCAGCHERIYREWSASNHAFALNDLQYQAELHKPSSPQWLCLNCHIPLQNQRRHILLGLQDGDVMRPLQKPNPGFDAELQKEAITCGICHIRSNQQGQSLIVGPNVSPEAPHPVKCDKKMLRHMCLRCHDPKGERVTPTLVCWFHTHREWSESTWQDKLDCVDCHMPQTKRRIAVGFDDLPSRKSHQHHWVGSGIPKWYDGYDKLTDRGYHPGGDIKRVDWKYDADSQSIMLEIFLHNARAGHWLPTGDPERALLFIVYLEGKGGKQLVQATHRIGQTWNWQGFAKKLGDNRLKVDEQRVWKTTLNSSEISKETKLIVIVYHLRLTSDNARHMKATRVTDTFIKDVSEYVRNIEKYYPMVNIIYREEIELTTGARRVFTFHELIELSKIERTKTLEQRDY